MENGPDGTTGGVESLLKELVSNSKLMARDISAMKNAQVEHNDSLRKLFRKSLIAAAASAVVTWIASAIGNYYAGVAATDPNFKMPAVASIAWFQNAAIALGAGLAESWPMILVTSVAVILIWICLTPLMSYLGVGQPIGDSEGKKGYFVGFTSTPTSNVDWDDLLKKQLKAHGREDLLG